MMEEVLTISVDTGYRLCFLAGVFTGAFASLVTLVLVTIYDYVKDRVKK